MLTQPVPGAFYGGPLLDSCIHFHRETRAPVNRNRLTVEDACHKTATLRTLPKWRLSRAPGVPLAINPNDCVSLQNGFGMDLLPHGFSFRDSAILCRTNFLNLQQNSLLHNPNAYPCLYCHFCAQQTPTSRPPHSTSLTFIQLCAY